MVIRNNYLAGLVLSVIFSTTYDFLGLTTHNRLCQGVDSVPP